MYLRTISRRISLWLKEVWEFLSTALQKTTVTVHSPVSKVHSSTVTLKIVPILSLVKSVPKGCEVFGA